MSPGYRRAIKVIERPPASNIVVSIAFYEAFAESAGVKSVPALVMDGTTFHINFGAGIEALE